MKTENLSKFGKVLYYTGTLKNITKKHELLELNIRCVRIRILHPLGLIIFIFTMLIGAGINGFFGLKNELKQFTLF